MAQHFAHEVRVAVGLAVHGVRQAHSGVIEGLTGRGLYVGHHVVVVQPGQLDAADATLPAQRGQGVGERVGARQFAVAIGPEYKHPHGLIGRGEMPQQQQAPLVGPLKVIEHEDDGLVL